jgi:hypothetical protein
VTFTGGRSSDAEEEAGRLWGRKIPRGGMKGAGVGVERWAETMDWNGGKQSTCT